MFQSEFYMTLSFVMCVCVCFFFIFLYLRPTTRVILVVYVCLYIHLPPLSSSTCCSVSVSACVGLMERPSQPSPHWDIMVRQTYSTTQIKINKQSEVFALNTAPFFKLCFFNEYTTWSGPRRRRQLLSLGEIRWCCENKEKIEGESRRAEEKGGSA